MSLDKLKGIFFGSIVGDVYGAPYEFEPKEYMIHYEDDYKHGEYSEGGPFNLPKGYYTDDTSMMLCLAQSLIDKQGIDMHDQALKYIDWFKNGYMSSTGECFDIGTQTCKALKYYSTNKQFLTNNDENACGNGALMRMAPIPIVYTHKDDKHNISWKAIQQTQVTHDNGECKALSAYFSYMISTIINDYAYYLIHKKSYVGSKNILDFHFHKFFNPDYEALGNGYAKDSMFIAMESVLDSDNFIDAIIKSIDYGYDTDTNACITGIVAGAVYGYENIPKKLITSLKDYDMMNDIFDNLIKLRDNLSKE